MCSVVTYVISHEFYDSDHKSFSQTVVYVSLLLLNLPKLDYFRAIKGSAEYFYTI